MKGGKHAKTGARSSGPGYRTPSSFRVRLPLLQRPLKSSKPIVKAK
ncbi:MAG: hypothetical protein WCO55_04915 [Candidatus Falkowbacteria bacterium]